MPVLKNIRRTLVVLVTGIVAVLAASLAVVPSASAASHDGVIVMKGVGGSAYTRNYLVSQVGKEGATLTWTFQVRNTGSTLAQYRLNVYAGSTAVDPKLYDGSLLLKPLANSPDGYYTKAIPAGGNQTLTLKFTVPAGTPAYEHTAFVYLHGTDGYYLGYAAMVAEEPAVLAGGSAADLFVKQGGQAAVGGTDRYYQAMTAPTISGTTAATFSATLQNSTSATPTPIGFQIQSPYGCGTITVKDGSLDVTAAALAGTYQSPPLAKLGKKVLTISIKNLTGCFGGYYYVISKLNGSGMGYSSLVVNKAA